MRFQAIMLQLYVIIKRFHGLPFAIMLLIFTFVPFSSKISHKGVVLPSTGSVTSDIV